MEDVPPSLSHFIPCTLYRDAPPELVSAPPALRSVDDPRILLLVCTSVLWPHPGYEQIPYVPRLRIAPTFLEQLHDWTDAQALKDRFVSIQFERVSPTLIDDSVLYLELQFRQQWKFAGCYYVRLYKLGTVSRQCPLFVQIADSNVVLTLHDITPHLISVAPVEAPCHIALSPPEPEPLSIPEPSALPPVPEPLPQPPVPEPLSPAPSSSPPDSTTDIIEYQPLHRGQPSRYVYIFHRMSEEELAQWCQLCVGGSFKLDTRLKTYFPLTETLSAHTDEMEMYQDAVLIHLWLNQLALVEPREKSDELYDRFEQEQTDMLEKLLAPMGRDLDDLFLTARLHGLVLRKSELSEHESFVDYFVELHTSSMRRFFVELRDKLTQPQGGNRILSVIEEEEEKRRHQEDDERNSALYLYLQQHLSKLVLQ